MQLQYVDLSDEQLMERVRTGDGRAIATLYDRYGVLVFSLALRMLNDRESAEELVQEVFLRAWRQAASYQPGLGKLSTWLLGIARNLAVDELRRRGARPQRAGGESEEEQLNQLATPHSDDPAEQLTAATQRQEIQRALAQLPEAQRQVIELAYYGGLTQSEIAERLGDPLGTVKTRMRLATRKLRDLLREDQVLE